MSLPEAIEIATAMVIGHWSGRLALRAEDPKPAPPPPPPSEERNPDYCFTHKKLEKR